MAAFAFVLKNRRDVFGKSDGLGCGGADDARLGRIEAERRKSQEGRQGPQLKIDHNFPSLDDTAFLDAHLTKQCCPSVWRDPTSWTKLLRGLAKKPYPD
jgi:hypothetical protein